MNYYIRSLTFFNVLYFRVNEDIPGNVSKHKIHILKSKILELESYNAKLKEKLRIQQEQMTEVFFTDYNSRN